MKAVSTACLACHLLGNTPLNEPVWVPPPSFPPAEAASWLLPADAAAVSEVRSACRAVLAAWGLDDTTDSACLVMTELVTNAIKHGQAPIHVLIANHRTGLDIEVYDAGDELPEIHETGFDTDSEGGRGLPLVVGTLARSWTITRVTPAGKIVAAVVPRRLGIRSATPEAFSPHEGARLPARSVLGLLPQEWLATDSSTETGAVACEHGCETVSSPVSSTGGDFQLLPTNSSGWQMWDSDPQVSRNSS